MTMSAAVSSPTSVSVVSERSRLLSFSRRASRSFFSLSSHMILTRAIRCPFPSFRNLLVQQGKVFSDLLVRHGALGAVGHEAVVDGQLAEIDN